MCYLGFFFYLTWVLWAPKLKALNATGSGHVRVKKSFIIYHRTWKIIIFTMVQAFMGMATELSQQAQCLCEKT